MVLDLTSTLKDKYFSLWIAFQCLHHVRKSTEAAPADNIIKLGMIGDGLPCRFVDEVVSRNRFDNCW